MAYIVMAYIVMSYIVMAYIVMADIVMACPCRSSSLYSYGPYSRGPHRHGTVRAGRQAVCVRLCPALVPDLFWGRLLGARRAARSRSGRVAVGEALECAAICSKAPSDRRRPSSALAVGVLRGVGKKKTGCLVWRRARCVRIRAALVGRRRGRFVVATTIRIGEDSVRRGGGHELPQMCRP